MSEFHCPACGSPIDYCQGHGPIGDPEGALTLEEHDAENHERCHPRSECRHGDHGGSQRIMWISNGQNSMLSYDYPTGGE